MKGADIPFRSGFVAIVGRPNVGKSTLLNRFAGQKVAIVSAKPQTTRHNIRGIVNREAAQIVFVDTPGIHRPLHLLGQSLLRQAETALQEVDVVVMMADGSEPPGPGDRIVAELALAAGKPVILALNKVDRGHVTQTRAETYARLGSFADTLVISAQRGTGCQKLLEAIESRLPEGPHYYDTEEVTDQTLRQLAGEFIREQVLRQTEEEVPHSVAVRIDTWTERADGLVAIEATIFVERTSQKGILIGQAGARLKEIGIRSREAIEKATGQKVFLKLWVKVLPNWRRQKAVLARLGYVVE